MPNRSNAESLGDNEVPFLDRLDDSGLKLRLIEALDRIEEEHRVVMGIAHRLLGGSR